MILKPFFSKFPKIAEVETKTLKIIDDDNDLDLPVWEYGFVDMYCDDDECDCNRVLITVFWENWKTQMANISYWWKKQKFYDDWFYWDKKLAKNYKWPELAVATIQTEHSHKFLKFFKFLIEDPSYVERLKRHYRMYKGMEVIENNEPKIWRNDSCLCWSWKKYKKCCLG